MPKIRVVVDKRPALDALNELNKASRALASAFRSIASTSNSISSSLLKIAETGNAAAGALNAVVRGIGPGTEKLASFQRNMRSTSRTTNNLARAFERLQVAQDKLSKTPTPVIVREGGGRGGGGRRNRNSGRGPAVREIATIATLVQGPLSGIGARAIAAASAISRLGLAAGGLLVGMATLGIVVGKGVFEFARLEREMANVAKNAGLTRRQTTELANSIRELAIQSGTAAVEIAKIADVGARLGVRGTANLAEFADTIVRLVQSTDLQGSQAALQLVRILTLLGDSVSNVRTTASVLVDLGSQAATTESQILTFATNMARVLSGFRVKSQDVLALAAAFAETGSAAEISRSTMQSALRAFDIELSSTSTRLTEIMKDTRENLRQAFDTDPIGFFVRFLVDARKEMNRTGESARRLVESIGIREKRTSQALGGAISTAPVFLQRLQAARREAALPSAIFRQSERVRGTLQERAKRAGEAIDRIIDAIGAKLAPALEGLADFITRTFGDASRDVRALGVRDLVDILRKPLGSAGAGGDVLQLGPQRVDLEQFFSMIDRARRGRLTRSFFIPESTESVSRELAGRIGDAIRSIRQSGGAGGPATDAARSIASELKSAIEAGDTKRITELTGALKEFLAELPSAISQAEKDALAFVLTQSDKRRATDFAVRRFVRRVASDLIPAQAIAERALSEAQKAAEGRQRREPARLRPDQNLIAFQRARLPVARQLQLLDLLDLPKDLADLLGIVRGAVDAATQQFGGRTTRQALSGATRALAQFSLPERRSIEGLFDAIRTGVSGVADAASEVELLARFGPQAGGAIAAIATAASQLADINRQLREQSLSEEQRARLGALADTIMSQLIDSLNAAFSRAQLDRDILRGQAAQFIARGTGDFAGARLAQRRIATLNVDDQVAALVAAIRKSISDPTERDRLIKAVEDAGERFKRDIRSGATLFNQAVAEAADNIASGLSSLLLGGRANIINSLKDILGAGLQEAFRPLADTITDVFRSITKPVTDVIGKTISGLVDDLLDDLPKQLKQAIAVVTLATLGLVKAFTPLKASGRIIVDGTNAFIDGIKGSARALDDLRKAAQGLISAFQSLDEAFAAGGDTFLSLLSGLDVTVKPKKKKPIRIKGLGKFESEDAAAAEIIQRALQSGRFANQPALQTALSNVNLKGASLKDIQDIVDFVGDFLRGFDQLEPPTTDLIMELKDLGKQFDEAAAKAKQLGLDVRAVDLAREIATAVKKLDFAKEIQVGLLEFLDPVQAELAKLEDIQRERIENAKALGLDLAAVEKLNALERARAIEEAERRTKGALIDLLNELRTSAQSPLPNEIVFANAKERFSELQQRFFAGDTSVADDLANAARNLLDVARQRFASSPEFFEIFKTVEGVLQQAVDFSVPEEQLRELQMLNDQIDSMRSSIDEMRDMLRQIVEASNSSSGAQNAVPGGASGGNTGGLGFGSASDLGVGRVVAA